jgi:hypothetical protein
VQMPGQKEPAIIGINVGKAALGRHPLSSGSIGPKISRSHEWRSHECERCTHECVRHGCSIGRSLDIRPGRGAA